MRGHRHLKISLRRHMFRYIVAVVLRMGFLYVLFGRRQLFIWQSSSLICRSYIAFSEINDSMTSSFIHDHG